MRYIIENEQLGFPLRFVDNRGFFFNLEALNDL